LEVRRNVAENNCNSGDGTDQTFPIFDVYDDDDDDDDDESLRRISVTSAQETATCFHPELE